MKQRIIFSLLALGSFISCISDSELETHLKNGLEYLDYVRELDMTLIEGITIEQIGVLPENDNVNTIILKLSPDSKQEVAQKYGLEVSWYLKKGSNKPEEILVDLNKDLVLKNGHKYILLNFNTKIHQIGKIDFKLFDFTKKNNRKYQGTKKSINNLILKRPIGRLESYEYVNRFLPLPPNLEKFVKYGFDEREYNMFFINNQLERKLVFIYNEVRNWRQFDNLITTKIILKNSKDTLTYKTDKDPIRYRYNDRNYTVVEQSVPFREIENIIVDQGNWWKKPMLENIDNSNLKSLQELNSPYIDQELEIDVSTLNEVTESTLFNIVFRKELEFNDIRYIPTTLKTKGDKFYQGQESLDAYLKTDSLTLIEIKNNGFWNRKVTKPISEKDLVIEGYYRERVLNLLESYNMHQTPFNEVFDIEKTAKYIALSELFGSINPAIDYLVYNSDTELLEPLYINQELGKLNYGIKSSNVVDLNFLSSYSSELKKLSKDYVEEILLRNKNDMTILLSHIHQKSPYLFFDESVLKINQRSINKSLNPVNAIFARLIDINDDSIAISIKNLSVLPLEIKELIYSKKNRLISVPDQSTIIQKDSSLIVTYRLPEHFENLFIGKKAKQTGFIFSKHFSHFRIKYSSLGLDNDRLIDIIPYKEKDDAYKEDDLFRKNADDGLAYSFISQDKSLKTISFLADKVILDKPLILPKGYTIIGHPGLEIDIIEGGKIISYSGLIFQGDKNAPIKIYSTDGRGQGLLVIGAEKKSILEHVEIEGLSNPIHGKWSVSGAITFYESPVKFDFIKISNINCEDAINVVRTSDFEMNNSRFENVLSDAFDGDFVDGRIINTTFNLIGNDAIDVSGSVLQVSDVDITGAGDKALSAGEESKMNAKNITIQNSEIALSAKDKSKILIEDLTVKNCNLGFAVFQKKPEFGPASIVVNKLNMSTNKVNHLIEISSSLSIDGVETETTTGVEERLYGADFGKSSKSNGH